MWTNVVISDDLLIRARSGDAQALAELWDACAPIVEASLRRHGRLGHADADDLAQEAALHFLAYVRSSAGDGTAFAESLAHLLRWRVHNFLRRERRRSAREHAADLSALESTLAKKAAGAEKSGPPGVSVRNALSRLSPRQRAVIAGLYFQDQTVAGLARDQRVTPQAISAVHRRALEVLRKVLSEEEDGS